MVVLVVVVVVDADSAGSKILVEKTVCSVVMALFQAITNNTNRQDLDQAISIVRRAHGQRSNAAEIALCDGGRSFLSKVQEKEADSGRGAEAASGIGRAALEAFSEQLALVLLEDGQAYSSDAEHVRKSRAGLGLGLAQSRMCTPTTREKLATILGGPQGWLQTERSRPLRELVEKAIAANQKALA